MTQQQDNRIYKHHADKFYFILQWILLFAIYFSASSVQAFGPTECPGNRLGSDLVCTANDVSITGIAINGGAPSCVGGSTANFDLDLTVNSATPNRYDIGIFISNDGKDPQLTLGSGGPASCSVDILPPNDPPFRNLDPGPIAGVTDVCGDVNGTMNGGTGTGVHTMTNVSVACQSAAGSGGKLHIPFAVSWDNTAGATCTSSNDVFPNTKSKCNSPTVLQSTVNVVVLPTISKTDGRSGILPDTDNIYTVVITNTTGAVLSNAIFTDPAVTDLDVDNITCSASGGATCPSFTIAEIQGAGVTIPDMPIDSNVTFTIEAEVDDDATGTLTNTANVTVAGYTNSASDVDIIFDSDVIPEISKTDNKTSLASGASTTYSIVIENTTNGVLSNAIFTDPAVSNLTINTFTCAAAGGASCPVTSISNLQGAGIVIPPMPEDSELTFTINATLAAGASGTITNTANIIVGGQTNSGIDSNRIQAASGDTCGLIPSNYPVYSAGDDLDIKDDVLINIGAGDVAVEEGKNNGNAIDVTGTVGDVIADTSLVLPTIDPATFPANSSNDDQTIETSDSPFTFNSTVQDSYKTITIEDDVTSSFIGGGPFYIDELKIGKNAVVNLAAGDYYINKLTIDDDSKLNITSEVVNIYINDEFKVDGDDVTINEAGNVGGLIVYLYDDADFKADKRRLDFTGIIYGPDADDIKFGRNTAFHGAVIGGDDVEFGDDSVITYTPADATAVGNISTCQTVFNHYAISHPGTGITCSTTAITISGHTAGDAITPPPAGTTITVSVNSSTLGTWSLNAGNGNFTALANGTASYEFDGTETSVILDLLYPQTGTININVTDGSFTESEDPDLVIGRAILEWSTINTQLSGKPSNVGFGAQTITLQALRASDSNSAVCEPAFISGSTVNIDLGAECINPNTCAGQQISITNNSTTTAVSTNNDNAGAAGTTNYTTVPLLFGANATANIVINYPDAGQMQLHALYNITNPDFAIGTSGSSNLFVVRPLALRIPVTGNNAATSNADAVSFTAGVDFSFDLEGVLWQQADDTNDDGIADGFNDNDPATNPADISDNAVAPNFNATASLAATLWRPIGGAIPPLSSASAAISNGSSTVTANWPEVGIIEIGADVSNYLGSGQDVLGRSSYVGRFIPDRFDVSDNSPTLADSCGAFSYMDQSIDFATNPVITLTAREEGGDPTTNYDLGGFWKYTANLANRNYTNNATTPAILDAPIDVMNIALTGDTNADAAGELTISNEPVLYQRPADPRDTAGGGANPAIPFAADIDLNFTISDLTDTDGVCYDSNNDGNCQTYSVNNIGGTQLRFGRLNVNNAFGSELVDLQLAVTAQYYDSLVNDFIASAGDTCTTLTVAPAGPPNWGQINLSNYQDSLSAGETTPTLSAFANGIATLTLSAPDAGNQGSVLITPLLESGIALEQPWLQFDWDGDGNHDNDPTGTATFGIYQGNDSTIYLKELY